MNIDHPGLTATEVEELARLANALSLDEGTRRSATNLLAEFRRRAGDENRAPQTIRAAIFIASKSQVLTTLKGETVRGIGVSFTQLLRASPLGSVEDFILTLKEFLKRVTIDAEVEAEIERIVARFSFLLKFHTKYEATLKRFSFKELCPVQGDYVKMVTHVGWLLFVEGRARLLGDSSEIVETATVLVGVVHFALKLASEFLQPSAFDSTPIDYSSGQEKAQRYILERLLEAFGIRDQDYFHALNAALQEHLRRLLESDGGSGVPMKSLLDPNIILQTYIKLDTIYQRRLGIDDLDERFFLRERPTDCTPSKFTPFVRQGGVTKHFPAFGHGGIKHIHADTKTSESLDARPLTSQRMLNYEVTENISIRSNIHEIKFSNFTQPSPGLTKSMITKTPMTLAMEMYNWLYEQVGRSKAKKLGDASPSVDKYLVDHRGRTALVGMLERIVERVLAFEKTEKGVGGEKVRENRRSLIVTLYHKSLAEILGGEERKGKANVAAELAASDDFHKALLACCIETIYFILNSLNVAFPKLLELCEVQPFEFWRVISLFSKWDASMPSPIRRHLADTEVKILGHLAWKKDSAVHLLIKSFAASAEEGEGRKVELTGWHEMFFKRVLHFCAVNIHQLTSALGLNEKTAEGIWSCVKYILVCEPELLVDRHIDQMTLCSIYSVCKVFQHPIKFQEIINKYQELQPANKQLHQEIIYAIEVEPGRKGDLILFYNTVFIAAMKTFILGMGSSRKQSGFAAMKPPSPGIKRPIINVSGLQSPLKALLPTAMQNFSVGAQSQGKKNGLRSPLSGSVMTPKTQFLFAFGETPSVRHEGPSKSVASKKMINFDAEVGNENVNTSNLSSSSISNSILMKKEAKYGQIQLEKITETKTENHECPNSSRRGIKGKMLFGSSPARQSNDSNQSMSTTINTPRSGSTSKTRNKNSTSIMKQIIGNENTSLSPNVRQKNARSVSRHDAQPLSLSQVHEEKLANSGSNTPEFRNE
eukprot:TRINITY_DN2945_c0_g2_i2.p1 TRINITY_DN2945_c0_g2~~TRINITY_DN2945_c0_g2_i2.p1  ORF type:complete len:992 (+),score=245.91 TRINITY_DN2945_c0_g2_i2:123-3098(+)